MDPNLSSFSPHNATSHQSITDLHLDRKDMDLHNEGRQHVMDRMAEIGQTLSPNAQVCVCMSVCVCVMDVVYVCMVLQNRPRGRSIHSIPHQTQTKTRQRRLVSLGDLGAYGEAGTTASFELAKDYLDGFGLGYNLVTGNHDLEGMQQFDTGAFCGFVVVIFLHVMVGGEQICIKA